MKGFDIFQLSCYGFKSVNLFRKLSLFLTLRPILHIVEDEDDEIIRKFLYLTFYAMMKIIIIVKIDADVYYQNLVPKMLVSLLIQLFTQIVLT